MTGRLKQRTFDDREGQRRTTVEIDAQEIAAPLTYTTATAAKIYRSSAVSQSVAAPVPSQSPGPAQQSQPQAPPRATRSERAQPQKAFTGIVQHGQRLVL